MSVWMSSGPRGTHGAFILTTLFIILVGWDCRGTKISKPHNTAPGIILAPVPRKLLLIAGLCQLCQGHFNITSKTCSLTSLTHTRVSRGDPPTLRHPMVLLHQEKSVN